MTGFTVILGMSVGALPERIREVQMPTLDVSITILYIGWGQTEYSRKSESMNVRLPRRPLQGGDTM